MIEIIHEHSVDTSMLNEGATVLDIGCRGFLFSNYFKQKKCRVYCVDIEMFDEREYIRCAISDKNGIATIIRGNDPQATKISFESVLDLGIPEHELDFVPSVTMDTFCSKIGIPCFDLIKMDIEGSEYGVIMSLEKAPAKQLSIEFHLHCGVYGMYEMTLMEDKLKALGYIKAVHELTEQHGAGQNYWDSLFILRQ